MKLFKFPVTLETAYYVKENTKIKAAFGNKKPTHSKSRTKERNPAKRDTIMTKQKYDFD